MPWSQRGWVESRVLYRVAGNEPQRADAHEEITLINFLSFPCPSSPEHWENLFTQRTGKAAVVLLLLITFSLLFIQRIDETRSQGTFSNLYGPSFFDLSYRAFNHFPLFLQNSNIFQIRFFFFGGNKILLSRFNIWNFFAVKGQFGPLWWIFEQNEKMDGRNFWYKKVFVSFDVKFVWTLMAWFKGNGETSELKVEVSDAIHHPFNFFLVKGNYYWMSIQVNIIIRKRE